MEERDAPFGFPSHEVPNEQKDKEWIRAFMMAAEKEIAADQFNVFYGKRHVYSEIREHCQGNQPVNKYKEQLGLDESDNMSHYAIRWKPIAILPRLRRMALSSMSKRRYEVSLNTIDPRITKEDQTHMRKVEAKLKLREGLSQIDPNLANSPSLQSGPNEPKNMFEMETYRSFGYKHNLVEGFERANRMVLSDNKYEEEIRDIIDAQLMDFGVGMVRQTIDERGRICIEPCEIPNVVTSYFRRNDAQDARYIGQWKNYSFGDIRTKAGDEFSAKELTDILAMFAGRHGNPNKYPDIYPQSATNLSAYDAYKVPVLELEFMSTNYITYETRKDKRGNTIRRIFKDKESKMRKKNKYERVPYIVVYEAKLIAGTSKIFNYGIKTNMPKKPDELHGACYSYKAWAPYIHDMTVIGKMEECLTIDDMINIAWFKMQNEVASAVPNGWFIDFDSLEEITFGEGEGGETWNQKKVLDLFMKKGVLVGRRKTMGGKIDPNKSVEPLTNDSLAGVSQYYEIIQQNIQLLRQTIGVNEYVDGSNIDSRTLKNVTELAQESMNNSLYDVISSERKILHKLSEENVLRVQDLIRLDALHPSYEKALGERTMATFDEVGDDITSYCLNVEVDFQPTDMDRQLMLQRLSQYAPSGLVDPSDEYLILKTKSMKVAWSILDSRIRQRREEKRQEQLALMQQNAKSNAEAGIAVEQAKQQTLMVEGSIDERIEALKKTFDKEIAKIKGEYGVQSASVRAAKD